MVRGRRGRIILSLVVVLVAAAAFVPAFIAEHYASGPGGAEVGRARVDRGWEFIYHAVRLSRGAKYDTEGSALTRARTIWSGTVTARSVRLVYMDARPFRVPVPDGGTRPRPARRVATPASRLGWVVTGTVAGGPPQMIGLIDYHSGRTAWNIRPLPRPGAR
ncbi:MAG: hypothetical protein AB7V42_13995 [Thermoleophilia bacterium]